MPLDIERVPEAVAIAALLGLKAAEGFSALRLADAVVSGVPASSLQRALKRIDPENRIVVPTDIVSRATLARLKSRQACLSPEAGERVVSVLKVYLAALKAYGRDSAAALDFLGRRHALLDGKRPIDVATASTVGADAVLDLIAAADAGLAA